MLGLGIDGELHSGRDRIVVAHRAMAEEHLLKHVVADVPFPWTLREGAKGVQLAELSWESNAKGAWVDVP